ncbi:hypothetical protein CDG24_25265 [Salmonella enterica subsp. enterica serovar Newport]|nr:hypothetical protein [Salmonella enterica subsp. enterica serovar Newport]
MKGALMELGKNDQAAKVAATVPGVKAKPGRLQLNIHPDMLQAINLECEAGKNGGEALKITDIAKAFWCDWLKARGVTVPDNWLDDPKAWKTLNPKHAYDKDSI